MDPSIDCRRFFWLRQEPLTQLLERRASRDETEWVRHLVREIPVHGTVSFVQIIDIPGDESLTRGTVPVDYKDCQRRQLLAEAAILDDSQDIPYGSRMVPRCCDRFV